MERKPRKARSRRITDDDLRALLPGTLLDLLRSGRRVSPWGEWLDGTLMHCDVTGFTAMSERLAARGKEGAEIMAAMLNRFFGRMLEVASRWGGDQVKFGGDAMLLLFRGADHAVRAAACGLEMQAAMREFRQVQAGGEAHTLRMRAGAHTGRFFAASAGQPGGLSHFMLLGEDVNTTAAVEPAAAPGQVVVSAETARALGDGARFVTRPDGLARVIRTSAQPATVAAESRVPAAARAYAAPQLVDTIEASRISGIAGEHRRVTVMFINLLGLSDLLSAGREAEALVALDAYLASLLSVLERHGGYLAGSDVSEEGDKLIALFGAPVSHEHPERAALACAMDLQEARAELLGGLKHRIGINSGFAFAGEIGSPRRKELTVIGDAVNTAARLMAAAKPGQVIASADSASGCAEQFALTRMRPLRVKGKSVLVHAYRVEAAHERVDSVADSAGPMFGRDREIESLLGVARRSERGRGLWAYIWGEPGIGKSRLTSELGSRLQESGWRVRKAQAYAHTAGSAYAPWVSLLRDVLAHEGPLDPAGTAATVTRLAPHCADFSPLLLELLSLPADTGGLAGLDPGTRRQKLHETIAAVLLGDAGSQPQLVLFEDAHWADGASLEVLALLASETHLARLTCVTSREAAQPGALSAQVPALALHLERLGEGAARSVAVAEGLSGEEAEAIIARGAGNPLFLHELARARGAGATALPDNVQDLLMARADRLPPAERSVLRVASVIGPTFELSVLDALIPRALTPRRVREALGSLSLRGFTRGEGEGQFAFGHALMHDVVYDSLPFAERRRLHRAVAAHLESGPERAVAAHADLLLHHAEKGEDRDRIVRYAALSGDRAAAVFAVESAIERYRRALAVVEAGDKPNERDRSLLVERIGDCLLNLGRHQDASGEYQSALELAQCGGARRRRSLLREAGPSTARLSVLAQKIGYAVERSADYDGALPWFDRALAWLPPRKPQVAAQVCAARSGALYRKGNFEEAIAWGQRALRYAIAARSLREVAYARNMLGNSYVAVGRMNVAIRHFRDAVKIYHEIGDISGQAKANNNLGTCYHWEGVLDGALYHYRVAGAADLRVGDIADAAVAQNNVAEVLYLLGRVDESLAQLQGVLETQAIVGGLEDMIGLAHVNFSRCYLALHDFTNAWRHLRKAETHLRKVHAEGLMVEAVQQRAELLLFGGQTAAAKRQARRAIKEARRLNAPLLEPAGERALALALDAEGRAAEAERHLRTAVILAKRTGAGYEEARSALSLGELLARLGRPAGARMYLNRAQAIFRRMGAQHQVQRAEGCLERIAA